MYENSTFTSIQRAIHGRGSLNRLSDEVDRFGQRKIMLVTAPGLVRAGIAGRMKELLAGREIELFEDVEPDPSIETVVRCAGRARATNCTLIIGLGGGSSLDTAKCASIMVTNSGDVEAFLGID